MFACIMIRGSRNAPQDYATAQTLLDALTPYDQDDVQGHWSNEHMLMVQALTWNTPESRHENVPETCKDTGRVIISWVRLDNRTELCAQLGLTDERSLSDPQLILASHRKWGADCADKLEGDFSFIIYDPRSADCFCARDSIGAKPFFYYADKEVFIAASTAAIFRKLSQFELTPRRDWMVRFMMSLPHVVTKSAYENVARLAPAHYLQVSRAGTFEPHEYFEFKDQAPISDTRDPKYVEAYREAFHNAVEKRLRSDFLIGAENSGGLDSVSIMGHAVKHLPHGMEDFHCFGFPSEERTQDLILLASKHASVQNTHLATYLKHFGEMEDFDRAIKTLGYPVEHEQINLHLPALRQSQSLGIRTMLSGYGGDELVTNHASALKLELFENGQFKSLKAEMTGNALTRRIRFYKQRRSLKKMDTYTPIYAKIWERAQHVAFVKQDLLENMAIKTDYDARIQRAAQATTLNDRILRTLGFDQARVQRLEASTLMAQSHGVDYRWPLYGRQLILCFLQTPAIEKRHKSMGRYLHRRAIAGTIPDTIAWQKSKDMGAPIWDMFCPTLPELVDEASTSPYLAPLLDLEKLQKSFASLKQVQELKQPSAEQFIQERAIWALARLANWLENFH